MYMDVALPERLRAAFVSSYALPPLIHETPAPPACPTIFVLPLVTSAGFSPS